MEVRLPTTPGLQVPAFTTAGPPASPTDNLTKADDRSTSLPSSRRVPLEDWNHWCVNGVCPATTPGFPSAAHPLLLVSVWTARLDSSDESMTALLSRQPLH
jgi:hypothetical protein